MTNDERKKMQAWIENWKRTGPILERIRLEEHRQSNLEQILLSLSDVNDSALRSHPPQPTSGMIEMQRLFAKLRNDEISS